MTPASAEFRCDVRVVDGGAAGNLVCALLGQRGHVDIPDVEGTAA